MTPEETWESLVKPSPDIDKAENAAVAEELHKDALFRPSKRPSPDEILRLLSENEKDTVTVVAIGPLTNLAIAAAKDPETFLRAKEIVVMGGAISETGNVRESSPLIRPPSRSPTAPAFRLTKAPLTPLRMALNVRNQITPVAEFNTFADSVAAARVYALSSREPNSTMPPPPPGQRSEQHDSAPTPHLAYYPARLSRQLNVSLFPLDITSTHELKRARFTKAIDPLRQAGSPMAAWTEAFLSSTFNKVESLRKDDSAETVGLALHDPLCIWYCMTGNVPGWQLQTQQDVRIETSGQWTRGMCVIDRRDRKRREDDDEEGERPGDTGDWLSSKSGNRLSVCTHTPGADAFATDLLNRVFGLSEAQ